MSSTIAVPGIIRNLNISTSLINEPVYLQWDPPGDGGGDTVNYIITVSPSPSTNNTDSTGCTCVGETCITSFTSCNVTGLMFGVTYSFNISANNSVGMSDEVSGEVTVPARGRLYNVGW